MTPASMVAMPRSVPVAVAAFPAAARAGQRRNARFFRPVPACGGDDLPPSMAAVPASLRAIQTKRKLAAARRGVPRAAATSAAECAVAALVKAVEVVQGAAAGGAAEAARGAGDAVAWVFRKVHFQSPDLAVGLLGMVASCLGTAVEVEMDRMQAKKPEASGNAEPDPDDNRDTEDPEDLPELVEMDMEKELWARIGILHGDLYGDSDVLVELDEDEIQEINSARARRRKAAYERIIATGGANSLILSNYAQLLYEFDKDINRAEMYFKQAVAAEPADGEAMRRYAMFLWHARGDIGGAEDMFNGAIDEEPESSHHQSSYACFLWMTGGVETCLIDIGKNGVNDAE
ncbi:uncharacterized protein LOC133903628 [Phragmites australis]|uniref:uncharacterized protein LOC133903628 n=1 Tax=Phragmites australis TaxID=29695 RepID=UPI002D7811F8|nr:uncharacterized protein LOC133903628 [Phragmites australis]